MKLEIFFQKGPNDTLRFYPESEIIKKNGRIYVEPKLEHPHVYPSGCVDMNTLPNTLENARLRLLKHYEFDSHPARDWKSLENGRKGYTLENAKSLIEIIELFDLDIHLKSPHKNSALYI